MVLAAHTLSVALLAAQHTACEVHVCTCPQGHSRQGLESGRRHTPRVLAKLCVTRRTKGSRRCTGQEEHHGIGNQCQGCKRPVLQEVQQARATRSVGAPSERQANQSPAAKPLPPVLAAIAADQLQLVELAGSEVGYRVPEVELDTCVVSIAGGCVRPTACPPHGGAAANALHRLLWLSGTALSILSRIRHSMSVGLLHLVRVQASGFAVLSPTTVVLQQLSHFISSFLGETSSASPQPATERLTLRGIIYQPCRSALSWPKSARQMFHLARCTVPAAIDVQPISPEAAATELL